MSDVKRNMGANYATKQARKEEREAMVTGAQVPEAVDPDPDFVPEDGPESVPDVAFDLAEAEADADDELGEEPEAAE